MYGGSGVAVAAPDEKLCPRTLHYRFPVDGGYDNHTVSHYQSAPSVELLIYRGNYVHSL